MLIMVMAPVTNPSTLDDEKKGLVANRRWMDPEIGLASSV
jgi:hypothetical protein